MKLRTIVFLFLMACVLFLPSTSADYWNTSWSVYSTVTMNVTAPEDGSQVLLSSDNFTIPTAMWNEMNQDGNDTRLLNHNHTIEFPFWIEHLTARDNYSIWLNVTDNTSAVYQWYYGNPSVGNNSNGDTTFPLFDNFEPLTINETYLTNWTKSGSNPLQNKTCQNWLIAVYSNYNSEDKIYIFEQRNTDPSNNIEAWSFTRDNVSNSSNWTDHGVIFTGVSAHDDGHIEPHGIIFETQSMADAREGVGEDLGTPHWRLYYCGKGDGEDLSKYSESFIYAPENNLTNWTAYSSNPVYDHDAVWGFADPKVAIYNDQVWMLHGKYKPGTSADPAFFSVSDDGINSWTNKTSSWTAERGVVGTLVPFSNGILLTGNGGIPDSYNAHFTTTGDDKVNYSGNPILSLGAGGQWDDDDLAWNTIVIDKYGSSNLSGAGTYYMYYIGYNGSAYGLGLATSTTLTEEYENAPLNASKWTYSGIELSDEVVNINTANEYMRSISTFQYGYGMKTKMRINTYADYGAIGFKTGIDTTSTDSAAYWFYATPAIKVVTDDAVAGDHYIEELGNLGTGWRTYDLLRYPEASKLGYLVDGGDISSGNTVSSDAITTGTLPIQLHAINGNPSIDLDWLFVRKLNDNESIVTSISEPQYYADSLHYNVSIPYNFTIDSDGALTSNHSITSVDDTNDTAQSTGTSYLQINVYDNVADIVRNFTFTGDNLDWYYAANLSGVYALKNSSGTIQTESDVGGLVNFTTNLTPGTYWIEEIITAPTISLISFYPTPLNTNYTGATVISYMVESYHPLNLSSLAFLYGLNYTITGDMHNYIGVPPCDVGYDGIYRAPNRNVTPYLSWEFNDTITEGNVWQWGGGDNNSWWISKNPINATHTYINATGVTQHVLPSSFYLKKTAMYSAPKTGFEINRLQGIIIKMWNVEEIRNRNTNYFVNMYFDTSWESTLPNYPVEVGFCNFSYDPTVDDIDTSPDCTKFGEWNGDRWINHSWVPGPNASYAYPFVVNASQFTGPTPTDINYIWLRSNTISSKSYILNATNYDPGITNVTFAETETMWTYNELNGITTPVAYTPSFFATFVRDYEELLHHLYIADDTGAWGHSDIFNKTIGISSVPILPVSFEHFNITCQGDYIEDTLMDATYDEGSILVNIRCPADPDGGIVSHNLTLHYANNQTLVAVINDTFTTTGDEYVDINFTTTPYYSSSDFYTFRCVSTDDENDVATKWLISYFTLDADGNQGWVVDDRLLFWGMNDIPTLYATVANDSLISYNVGTNNYTTHVPFFKSKSNDTFRFNETVHLESLNDENVSYFRHSGETIFYNATIHAWNTTTDAAAPITDEYRGYVYSHFHVCGNITNSDFSYLGSDFYRQEGLNFVDNPHDYLIYNTTFSHNAEGPIMEYCSNMNISQCTITDNVNVGIGIYFTNDTVISNNVIDLNGGRGITMYEANNNIISYNDITNSGIYGVHYWSNSQNNTCTGNDISGSELYDYYLSSSSTGNYIIDPASTTDRIRVTSTSSVNIENTDNAVFSEDSLSTSYAYLTNFSMLISGASQTFDITRSDMTVLPSTSRIAIWNVDWNSAVKFYATSDTGTNPTWFNISKDIWSNETIYLYIDSNLFTNQTADENGLVAYNYSGSMSGNLFEFRPTQYTVWDTLLLAIIWAISIAQFLVANIGVVIVTAFSLTCILILMILIGMALSVTNIIYR